MTSEYIKEYLQKKAYVTQDFKIEWDAFRFHLEGKMFAMLGQNKEGTPVLTLKLPPQEGAYYREAYPELITPGYYMNKVHWISTAYESLVDGLLEELMDKSYQCGFQALPKKVQAALLDEERKRNDEI